MLDRQEIVNNSSNNSASVSQEVHSVENGEAPEFGIGYN